MENTETEDVFGFKKGVVTARKFTHEFKLKTKVIIEPAVTKDVFIGTDEKGNTDYLLATEFRYE